MAPRRSLLFAFVAFCGCAFVLKGCGGGPTRGGGPTPTPAPTPGLPGGFSVAEVKPHYQCSKGDGLDRVREHISGLVDKEYGIIALIQFESTLKQPEGYTAFGASCTTKLSDPVAVLVNEKQFSVIKGLGDTVVGDYGSMPFLTTGKMIQGSMCISDPKTTGLRGYAGAVLRENSTGTEFCVIAGTFPHCRKPWHSQFLKTLEQGCDGRQLLIIADTNAACETEGALASKAESMELIGKNHSAKWGKCSDPAIADPLPTCCHDLSQHHPEARFWYDRTALCGGGVVDQFQVGGNFVCGVNEEHKFTSAVVHLNATADRFDVLL